MSDKEFFNARKAAAVLKHGILTRYILPFATKVGSTAKDGRVVVLDGYAGEGRYEDDSPGSPIFMTESARKIAAPRKMELYFVEQEKARHTKLNEVLTVEADDVDWKTFNKPVHDVLDIVLKAAEGVPFFAFLDPCGLGLTFDDVVNKIHGRPYGNYTPGTEALINFSADAVRRIGGRLVKEPDGAQGREATLARMDANCGGDWWRQIYIDAGSAEEASKLIALRYFDELRRATKASGWVVEARNAPGQQPKYSLVFLTRHSDGMMLFGEAVSKSQEDWRKALIRPDELFSDEQSIKLAEDALVERWVARMKVNVIDLLVSNGQFRIRTEYGRVMAGVLGDARMTHLRIALKDLYKAGLTKTDEKGSPLWDKTVTVADDPSPQASGPMSDLLAAARSTLAASHPTA